MRRFPILDRIDATLEGLDREQVRAIYLTDDDRDALNRAGSRLFHCRLRVLNYRGHEIRKSKRSQIYTKANVSRLIPEEVAA